MDSTVKSLVITGVAAEDATRSRQKKISTRKQRLIIKEDDELIEQAKQHALAKPNLFVKPNVFVKQEIQKPVINLEVPQIKTIKPVESNVILKPPKVQRVKLQPKSLHQNQPSIDSLNTTRKARRIHLSTTNLSHRFTRAKRLKDDTDNKSVTSIREYLVTKGVIQQKSKAPESMLRSMYSDFMLLKNPAL